MSYVYKLIFIICIHSFRIISFLVPIWFRYSKKRKDILYLAAFPPNNSGHHYRVNLWAKELKKSNCVDIKYIPEMTSSDSHIYLIKGMIIRFFQVLCARNYKVVVVRRELLPLNDYGKLFLERLLKKISSTMILDFDDDISASKLEHIPKNRNTFSKLALEEPTKFEFSLCYYDKYITATQYLKQRFKLRDDKTLVMPTIVDYNQFNLKAYDFNQKKITLGWIGSITNQTYLYSILPSIEKLAKEIPLRLVVVSGKTFEVGKDSDIEVINKPWSLDSQVKYLYTIDIGLMPLFDNLITQGKAGFKLIQYMGLGIVSIASKVGFNSEIIQDGINGFLVKEPNQWETVLKEVVSQRAQFNLIGRKARETVEEKYSFDSHKKRYKTFVTESVLEK